MKKIFLVFSIFALLIQNIFTLNVMALNYGTWGDYKYQIEDGTAYIVDYIGMDENIVIPSEVNGYSVTGVGFPEGHREIYTQDNRNIVKTITIPEGVEYIGCSALCQSESLTSVSIPDSVTYIGEKAFYKCSALKTITIPESITELGRCVFEECKSLVSADVKGSVVGDSMFSLCESLETVNLSEDVKIIGENAFRGCVALESITNL